MCEIDSYETPIDVTEMSNEAICEMAKEQFRADGRSTGPKAYYCGITNNIGENRVRHRVPHLVVYQCKDADTAAEVEEMLGDFFDIGDPKYRGNGGNPDSFYVYLCYKSADFSY